MAKKRYKLIVSCNAVTGQDVALNEWYDSTHIADVLRVSGFVGAQRYRMVAAIGEDPYRYCAIYDLETDNPEETMKALQIRAGTADMPLSTSLDSKFHGALYEETGKKWGP